MSLFFYRKVKLQAFITAILVKIIVVLGAIAVAVLFFFAVIFLLASSAPDVPSDQSTSRLIVGVLLFIIGIAIVFGIYFTTRKPKTVIQRLEVSGQMKAASIKCPNCGGSVDANLIKIMSGVPYATCPYCGTTFEVTEEPKW
jgi:DNA-directed RNA polymerase subunit RPC12/RpoP